jgi:hypothetical protein
VGITTPDLQNPTDVTLGVAADAYEAVVLNLRVTEGYIDCDLEVLFWNDRAQSFVTAEPPLVFLNSGVPKDGSSKSILIRNLGRRLFVKFPVLEGYENAANGTIFVVSGLAFDLEHDSYFVADDGVNSPIEIYYDFPERPFVPGPGQDVIHLLQTDTSSQVRVKTYNKFVELHAPDVLRWGPIQMSPNKVTLSHDDYGSVGNVPIENHVYATNFSIVGMKEGYDPGVTAWVDVAGCVSKRDRALG